MVEKGSEVYSSIPDGIVQQHSMGGLWYDNTVISGMILCPVYKMTTLLEYFPNRTQCW